MRLFDRILRNAEQWLDDLDRERDLVLRHIAGEGRRQYLVGWLDRLDAERVKHVELIARMEGLRAAQHPALVLGGKRPKRMAPALLSGVERTRKRA